MRRKLGRLVSLLASIGWVFIAYDIVMAGKNQVPLTINQTIAVGISCIIVVFLLLISVFERRF